MEYSAETKAEVADRQMDIILIACKNKVQLILKITFH